MTLPVEQCAWCSGPMGDPAGTSARRRKDRVTCSGRCRKARNREVKRQADSNYIRSRNVTPGDMPFEEPPRPPASFYQAHLGDERFYRQLAQESALAAPLTDHERQLLARARRNIGVELPELTRMRLERELERQRAEAEDYSRDNPIRPEDQYDASTRGHLARRAQQSRQRNRPQDPNLQALRPGQSGPMPWDEEPQTISAPSRSTPRWAM